MSSAAHAQTGPPAPGAPSPWLYSRGVDLWLGYGLLYILSVPALVIAAGVLDLGPAAVWLPAALALLFSTPHYGATVLRVYEERENRRRYAFFAVWITLALGVLFAVGLFEARVGALLLTVYVTWSPWHFSGQNYGLAVMYLGRRGVPPDPGTKRLLYVSFVLSALLAMIAIHGSRSVVFSAGALDYSQTFRVLRLGVPPGVVAWLAPALGAAYLLCIGVVFSRLRARAGFVALVPALLLVCTQALWFTVPALDAVVGSGWTFAGAWGLPFATIWIAATHAIQYLWVTSYYARRSGGESGSRSYLVRCLLAGAFLLLPAFVLAPSALGGGLPNAAGVAVLVIAVMNIHHFFLDGAIWKLRDGRVARVLLRTQPEADATPVGPERRLAPWLKPAILGLGGVVVGVKLYTLALTHVVAMPEPDLSLVRTAVSHLAVLDADGPDVWAKVGSRAEQSGEPTAALEAYRRSLAFEAPEPQPWVLNRYVWLLLQHESDSPERLEEAHRHATELVRRVGESRPEAYQTLAEVERVRGEFEEAETAAVRALALAQARGDEARAEAIRQRLAYFRGDGPPEGAASR